MGNDVCLVSHRNSHPKALDNKCDCLLSLNKTQNRPHAYERF